MADVKLMKSLCPTKAQKNCCHFMKSLGATSFSKKEKEKKKGISMTSKLNFYI